MLLADSMLQGAGDLLTGGIVLLFAWLGSRYGLFLAILWGLQALASVVAAFAITDIVDGWLVWAGMTNEFGTIWRQSIAFVTSLLAVAIALRLAIGAWIEEGATNYPPIVDLAGGGAVGALVGLVVAGILQVVLAMAPLPERFAFDPSKSGWDLGRGIIELVGRCAPGLDKESRTLLLDGEPGFAPEKAEAAAPAPAAPVDPSSPPMEKIELPQWSELFADTNWNQMWDKEEKYLDADGNGRFTWVLRSNDVNTNKTRDIGLRERYALGPWVTVTTVEKQLVQRLQRAGKLGPIDGLPWPPPGGFNPGVSPPAAEGGTAPGGPPPATVVPQPGPTPVPGAPPLPPAGPVPGQAPPSPLPGQPVPPPPPVQGTLPGVPKQPGQPAAATPAAPTPPSPPPEQPPPQPPTPPPPIETPGRANETPPPPPGPQSPFKPKK